MKKAIQFIKLRRELQLARVKQAARVEYAERKGNTTAAETLRVHLNEINKELKALENETV